VRNQRTERRNMRRAILILGAVMVTAALAATPATATSPHFINASAARSGENLVVSWKESGLGDNLNIDYSATATASRVDSCVNGGNKVPSDPKKTTTVAQVSAEGTFSVKKRLGHGEPDAKPTGHDLVVPEGTEVDADLPHVYEREHYRSDQQHLRGHPGDVLASKY
jgi:hypothetical protein